jgi:hypothetical protein
VSDSIKSILGEISREAAAQGIVFRLYRQGSKHAIYHLGTTVVLPVPYSKIPSRIRHEMLKSCEPELGYRWWMPQHRRPAARTDLPDTVTKGYRGPRRKRTG